MKRSSRSSARTNSTPSRPASRAIPASCSIAGANTTTPRRRHCTPWNSTRTFTRATGSSGSPASSGRASRRLAPHSGKGLPFPGRPGSSGRWATRTRCWASERRPSKSSRNWRRCPLAGTSRRSTPLSSTWDWRRKTGRLHGWTRPWPSAVTRWSGSRSTPGGTSSARIRDSSRSSTPSDSSRQPPRRKPPPSKRPPGSLSLNLQFDIPDLDVHGLTHVHLDGDDAGGGFLHFLIDRFHAVEPQNQMVSVGDDLVMVPVAVVHLRFHLQPALVLSLHQVPALALFVVEIAPGGFLLVHLGGVRLVACHHPVGLALAAELDAGIVVPQLDVGPQREIGVLVLVDEKCVVLHRMGVAVAHDGPVLHRPQEGIAVPSAQIFAVKQ